MKELKKKELEELKSENDGLKWQLEHTRSQYHLCLEMVMPLLNKESKRDIFTKLGRNCAKSIKSFE